MFHDKRDNEPGYWMIGGKEPEFRRIPQTRAREDWFVNALLLAACLIGLSMVLLVGCAVYRALA